MASLARGRAVSAILGAAILAAASLLVDVAQVGAQTDDRYSTQRRTRPAPVTRPAQPAPVTRNTGVPRPPAAVGRPQPAPQNRGILPSIFSWPLFSRPTPTPGPGVVLPNTDEQAALPRPTRTAPRRTVVEATRPPSDRGDYETPPDNYIAVLGDNYAEWLAYGLEIAFEDTPTTGVLDLTQLNSGLLKVESYDWVKQAPLVLANDKTVAFAVIMVGLNDRQPLREGAQTIEFKSDRWREIYAKRVDDMIAATKTRGVPVFLVGMPPIKGPRAGPDATYMNEIFRERATAAGIPFIDVWQGFSDDAGEYVTSGPDMEGQVRRLRTTDGVYFTKAGATKLAHYVEREIRRILQTKTPSMPDKMPVGPEAGTPISGTPVLLNPQTPSSPLAPVRPAAGPIVSLTNPPSTNDPLAGAPGAPRGNPAATPAAAPADAPGRADDFRWPR